MADLDRITITRGDDAAVVLTITRNGSPLNLTDLAVSWSCVSNAGDATPAAGPYAATITDAPNGVCQVDIPSADSADLAKPAYLWDATVTDLGGKVVTVARGILFVLDTAR